MGCVEQETWEWEMNENEINDGSSYYLRETTEGFVKLKMPTYYIAKHSDEDLRAAVLAEREACAKLCEELHDCEPEPRPDDCATAIRGRTE
jgi:hypothetical protein